MANGDRPSTSLERAMQPAQPPAPAGEQPGTGERLLIGMGAGFTNLGKQVAQLLEQAGQGGAMPGTGMPMFNPDQRRDIRTQAQRIGEERIAEMQQFAETPVGQSGAGKVGKFTGEVLPTLVIPGGATGKAVTKMVTGAAGGAAAGFLQPIDDAESANEQRIINTLSGTVFGAAVPGLFDAAKWSTKTAHDITGAFTKAGGRRAVVESVARGGGEGALQEVTERARRLGAFVSPGEATNFQELVARERSMKLTDDLMSELGVTLRRRDGALTRSVKQLVDDIAPDTPERAQLITDGYEALLQTHMSPKLLGRIQDDPVLGSEWPRFLRAKGYRERLAELPEDSMARLDEFQKFLGESQQRLFTQQKGAAGKVVKDKRNLIRDLLDTTVPEYAVARREAQLNILQRQMREGLDKIKAGGRDEAGNPVTTPVQFYQRFLKSDEKFEELLGGLGEDHPALVMKAADLRTVLGAIEGSPLEKVFRFEEPLQTVRTGGQGTFGIALFESIASLRQQYNRGIVEALTDPALPADVFEEAARLANQGTPESVRASGELLTRLIARTVARGSVAEPEQDVAPTPQEAPSASVPSLLRAME